MHNNFFKIIEKIPSNRFFLYTKNRSYTYLDLIRLSDKIENIFPEIKNHNIAIKSKTREKLALYLPVVTKLAKRIFLLPNDIDASIENEFCEKASINFIIELNDDIVVTKKIEPQIDNNVNNYTEILLATSGTTGTPKIASHNLANLLSTSQNNVERGSEFCWGLCYDINRFAGLQVYLQALTSGSPIVCSESDDAMENCIELFEKYNVNCISATPSYWRKLLMLPHHRSLKLKRITLGGEISSQFILDALKKSFSNAKITHIYASTEAGVGFAVKDGLEGFPLSLLNDNPNHDYSVKILDDQLWLKSNRVCNKLLSGQLEYDNDGYINTGDQVKIDGERVKFLGRSSGSINIGGNKVMPEKIENILNSIDIIQMSRAFAKPNPLLGALVFAEIVLNDSGKTMSNKELKNYISNYCKDKLELYEIPVVYKVVERIDTNANGKISRN
ncbi:class I adenylate-forming enzyme family protein [Providencia alcalifaciens]|uniref:class I adenylate-forming enzyme family protein n=1 Tax=Providencia alcalifaciens TaxID=126385 RepID=UPI0032DAAE02